MERFDYIIEDEDKMIRRRIFDLLKDGEPRMLSDIQLSDDTLSPDSGISDSRLTDILTGLVNEGIVTLDENGNESYYSVPPC